MRPINGAINLSPVSNHSNQLVLERALFWLLQPRKHDYFLFLNRIDGVFNALQVLMDVSDVDGDVTDT